MPWSSLKTEGIILGEVPWKEVDRRYIALTPQFGKVTFDGKGARKQKAKLASHLTGFSIVDLEIIRGRKTVRVISAQRKFLFEGINAILQKRLLAQSAFYLLQKHTEESFEDIDLYEDVKKWLELIESVENLSYTRALFLLSAFLIRYLDRLGYRCELHDCLGCKKRVKQAEYKWHIRHGGVVCMDCIGGDREKWYAATNLEEEIIRLLRFARDVEYEDLLKIPVKGAIMPHFMRSIQEMVEEYLPRASQYPFWHGLLADDLEYSS